MKKALEAAGSDLDHVLKCNVLCISADRFKAFNEVYKRYFPKNPPARIFFCVPEWIGPFDCRGRLRGGHEGLTSAGSSSREQRE